MPVVDALIQTLDIAKVTATDVSIVKTALTIALSIANKAQEISDIRDDCRRLAERAANLTLAVYVQLKDDGGSTTTREHVTKFLRILQDIENLMDRRIRLGRRRRFLFSLKHGTIAKEVKELTVRYDDAYRAFMIQAAVDINQRMNTLASGNIRVMQHIDDDSRVKDFVLTGLEDLTRVVNGSATFDGNFRFFARENLDFVEYIRDASLSTPAQQVDYGVPSRVAIQEPTGRVVRRYRALVKAAGELSDTRVVVHTYPDHDDRGFVETVKAAQQVCHPYLLAVLGYSRPGDPTEASYVVTEDYFPLGEYASSFRGVGKLRVLLQMRRDVCVAVGHLEGVELPELLSPKTYWISGAQYEFGSGELVFDTRHGGRVKWARDPVAHKEANNREALVPAIQADRMRLLDDLRPAASTSVVAVVRCWFSQLLSPKRNVRIPGRTWWRSWQIPLDPPKHALGVWLGRNHGDEEWSVLRSRDASFDSEVATTAESKDPLVVPWQGSQREASSTSHAGSDDYHQMKMRQGKKFDIPDSDRDETSVDFSLVTSGTRWKRYQFPCIASGTTLLFLQDAHISDDPRTVARLVGSAPDPSMAGFRNIGISYSQTFSTETTVRMASRSGEESPPLPPLWFFILNHDSGCDKAVSQRGAIPWGFWSLEKSPTSIPGDVVFDPEPQIERIKGDVEAPLSAWTQVLGDLTFTVHTKLAIDILDLSEDELLALRELRTRRRPSGASIRDWDGPDVGYAASHGGINACGNLEGTTDSECDDLEEYYSAEEGEAAMI